MHEVKSPWGGTVKVDPRKCSVHRPDSAGTLRTGYREVCPTTQQPFFVDVTVTGVGSGNEQLVAVGREPAEAELEAAEELQLADAATAAAAAEIAKAGEEAVGKLLAALPQASEQLQAQARREAELEAGTAARHKALEPFHKARAERAKAERSRNLATARDTLAKLAGDE